MIVKIQNRRGQYVDFDPSKLLPGEFAIVQTGDPNTADGKAIYIGVTAGNVKQLATLDELQSEVETALQSAIPEVVEEATQEAQDAADRAEAAAQTLEIDTTLTETGQAAEAKATGDAIDELNERLDSEIADVKSDLQQTNGDINVIEPECIINGVVYGAGQHPIRLDPNSKTIVHKVSPNKIYRFKSETPRARFYTGCFVSKPEPGDTPIENTFIKHDGMSEFTISTTDTTEYIATYFYNPSLESITLEEAIRQLTVYEVKSIISEKVLDAIIYGGGSHDIRSDSGAKTAVYMVLPNTTYVLKNKTLRPRFSLACYTSEPVIGSTPIANTYVAKHNQNATEITFTTPSTAYYMATYFYNEVFDTKTADEVLADMSLVRTDGDSYSLDDIFDTIFGEVSENYKGLNFVSIEGALIPEYFITGSIHGSSNHQIVSDSYSKTVVYAVQHSTTYRVKSTKMKKRFSIDVFDVKPEIGTVPVAYEAHHGEKEFYITIPANCYYIAIYYYNQTYDTGDYLTVLKELTVSGSTRTSLLESVKYVNDKAGEYESDKEQAKSTFNICSWNIGHFSMGSHRDTDITDSDYETKLKAFYDMVRFGSPQIMVVAEYSRIFAALQRENILTADALFDAYKTKFIGEQRHYSCNAVFSNLAVRNMEAKEYACLANETITHTTLIEAQDYYYVQWDMVFNGVDIHCIATHCAFDTNRPDVLQQAQIQELITACSGYDHVLLAGDFNTTDFSAFTSDGYDMVNNAGLPFITGVDNILAKGMSITTKMRSPGSGDLSDHPAYIGQITVTVE